MRRFTLFASLTAAFALAAPAIASASSATTTTAPVTATGLASTTRGSLKVAVNVNRFYATAAGTKASGTATATLTPLGQSPTTLTKNVTLAATTSGKCTVLTLTLETLELKLLGLDVNLEKVVLTVTAEKNGGVLGSLFCSLTKAKVKLATRQAAAARLTSALRRKGAVRPIAFTTNISAQTAAAEASCPILNLVVGPLHLDLLGLVVDLNQVHLSITAEPNGGALGSLFCGLSTTKL